jgi:membrane fusion protein (multidrug efflux system)
VDEACVSLAVGGCLHSCSGLRRRSVVAHLCPFARRLDRVGNYVSVGGALMAVVPLFEVYIEANYREVQLAHVQAGQRARIHVDAYNIDLDGKVVDVPAASGTTFATLQPDNATGDFTKIVRRLPIKIVLAPNQPTARLLRVGLSVEATIQIP